MKIANVLKERASRNMKRMMDTTTSPTASVGQRRTHSKSPDKTPPSKSKLKKRKSDPKALKLAEILKTSPVVRLNKADIRNCGRSAKKDLTNSLSGERQRNQHTPQTPLVSPLYDDQNVETRVPYIGLIPDFNVGPENGNQLICNDIIPSDDMLLAPEVKVSAMTKSCR